MLSQEQWSGGLSESVTGVRGAGLTERITETAERRADRESCRSTVTENRLGES